MPRRFTLTLTVISLLAFVTACGSSDEPAAPAADAPTEVSQAPAEAPSAAQPDSAAAPVPPAAVDPATLPGDPISGPLETTPSGLQFFIQAPGTGATPTTGQTVAVHYTGYLLDGTQFDSSRLSGQPIEFPIGTGRVVDGWDEGIAAMQVGERRKLVIPPELGYGATGYGGGVIPPNAVLVFDVELISIK